MPFRSIIGQERALRVLRGMLGSGRLATSYLFAGEKGVGKFTTALAFAQALLCEAPAGGDACGGCSACLRTAALGHPDLMVVAPDGGLIKIEEVRAVEEFLSLTPYEGRKKVAIIDDADAMNINAENAFLKTLEEPPDDSVIILVSSHPDLLEETIRSRCLTVKFGPLSGAGLARAAAEVGKGDAGEAVLRLAMGRVGMLFDEELVGRRDGAFEAFQDMVRGKDAPALKEREAVETLIDHCLLFLRDMAVLREGGPRNTLVNGDIAPRLDGLCREAGLHSIMNAYGSLCDLRRRTAYNLNWSIVQHYLAATLGMLCQKAGRGEAVAP